MSVRAQEWETGGEGGGGGGGVSWEADGSRRAVALRVAELARGGTLQAAGAWTRDAGLRWTRAPTPGQEQPSDSMTNRTFIVLIAIVRHILPFSSGY